MKTERLVALILIMLLIAGGGIMLWLAQSSNMPPAQKVEQTIPDDRIPR